MPTPTDALALFRTVLANPADETPRLVFADWLEDTGERHNIAWAKYLRANTQGQSTFDGDLQTIRARLTLPVRVFVQHHPLLLKLLPAKNITVDIGDFLASSKQDPSDAETAKKAKRQKPQLYFRFGCPSLPSVVVLPIRWPTEVEFFGIFAVPNFLPGLQEKLEAIFECKILLVHAQAEQLRECIMKAHGPQSGYLNGKLITGEVVLPFREFPVVSRIPCRWAPLVLLSKD